MSFDCVSLIVSGLYFLLPLLNSSKNPQNRELETQDEQVEADWDYSAIRQVGQWASALGSEICIIWCKLIHSSPD
ncbi:unnamed protein product [Moneuplotes crassus]|uniref:Uncharacterized protein n=1 Tax=Euplotes crassus TaxID=5936 RepID=A0AAD1U179_EUPCR|nr:unnamed protein product [Moneuplotes crassus]